jgi:multidrug transporter EmrE-like cation transporter
MPMPALSVVLKLVVGPAVSPATCVAGTALTALIGVVWFKEPTTALKAASLGLIISGIVGLQLAANLKGD